MATATAPPTTPGGGSVLIDSVSWDEYEALLAWIGDRPIRVNYDRGRLEIMSPSFEHEWEKCLLSRFVGLLALELAMPIRSGGSTTFRQLAGSRGLEPDECFWFGNEPAVRDKTTWEAEVDPPPDLVIEVEVSRSVVDRLGILAGLGVPEVWTFDGDRLRVLLREDGGYRESTRSRCLPAVPVARLAGFLRTRGGELEAMQRFVAWVRAGFPET